ncbi:MAG: CoA transferase [Nitriliruptoraceae bacterium]
MKPLADLRILAIEQNQAGSFGSMHLADLGADVIKIEDARTGGDQGRYVEPFQDGDDSLFFQSLNRNKRSIAIDLSAPAGRKVFEDLVARSDAVYANLRGDLPRKLQICYDDLKHVNPAIVCCSLSDFGMTGPRHAQEATGAQIEGIAAWMSLTGEPQGPPIKSGLPLVEFCAGLVAALALMCAVHAAQRDGVGMDCDTSLFDTAMSLLSYQGTWHLSAGFEPVRVAQSGHPSLVPVQLFQALDGWFVVMALKEKFWQRIAIGIGRPELIDDPGFSTFAARYANRQEVVDVLSAEFIQHPRTYWISVFEDAGVPVAAVNSVSEAMSEPHTLARDVILNQHHPVWGQLRQIGSPVRVGETRTRHNFAPGLGEHTATVLRELLGYSPEEVAAIQRSAAGAV